MEVRGEGSATCQPAAWQLMQRMCCFGRHDDDNTSILLSAEKLQEPSNAHVTHCQLSYYMLAVFHDAIFLMLIYIVAI